MVKSNNEITQIMKMFEKMQVRMNGSDKGIKTMVAAL